MDVRRRTARLAAVLLLAGAGVLAAPAAFAQEADPCAPAADGSVPEMCQGGEVPETDPADPCPAQPVEPGDGVVTDEGDQGVAVGEPHPDAPPSDVESDPAAEGEVKPEPAPEDPTMADRPGAVGDEGVICAFGVPVSAPVDSAAGGAPDATAPEAAVSGGNTAVASGQLPRTGLMEQLLLIAAGGAALLVLGVGALAVARRREVQV